MLRDVARSIVDHHIRSNERILETAATLPAEELNRPGPFDHGSAHATLSHLVVVDWGWRDFCETLDDNDSFPAGWPFPDLDAITRFSSTEHERLRRYVGGLDEDALAERLSWEGEGETFSAPRWAILLHVMNHGTQHRSELARFFTDLGRSPGDMDFL